MLAVSVCAMPFWAMSSVGNVKADDAAWKAAWLRGIQQLPPVATPFAHGEVKLQSVVLQMPAEEGLANDSFRPPLYTETPFMGLGEPSTQQLLTDR